MTTRDLLSGPITLSSARARSSNVLHALAYPKQKEDFYKRMESHRPLIADVVAHHLGTESTEITVSSQDWWRHGSFNLCIPIRVDVDRSAKQRVPEFVLIRFPLPYRVGEATKPGNSDEKVNCEAATYAWLQENCPSVPIPKLYGFGLSTNQRVSALTCKYAIPNSFSSIHSLRISTFVPGGRACSGELEDFFQLCSGSNSLHDTYATALAASPI